MDPIEYESLLLDTRNGVDIKYFFVDMPEFKRKKYSTLTQKLFKQLTTGTIQETSSKRIKTLFDSSEHNPIHNYRAIERLTRNVCLALGAVGPLAPLKRRDFQLSFKDFEIFLDIVINRKPKWLNDVIEHHIDQDFTVLRFKLLWPYISEGKCNKPETDSYYSLFANDLPRYAAKQKTTNGRLAEFLLSEPVLFNDVWKIFSVESHALSKEEKHDSESFDTWTETLINLSENGDINRFELLEASIDALYNDFKQNQYAKFYKFHKILKPTSSEKLKLQPNYRNLLSHQLSHVVKFSLEMLASIQNENCLDADAFLSEIPTVFLSNNKGLLHGKSSVAALRAIAEALCSPLSDIQEQSIALLEGQRKELPKEAMDTIHSNIDFVFKGNLKALSAIIGECNSTSSTDELSDTPGIESLRLRADKLSPTLRSALRIDALLEREQFNYVAIDKNILHYQILPTENLLTPIDTVDELIDAVSRAVECIETPDTVELIIDGIARLSPSKDDEFTAKTAPLMRRLMDGGAPDGRGLIGYHNIQSQMFELLIAWLTGKRCSPHQESENSRDNRLNPTIDYVESIKQSVLKDSTCNPLATPTHTGGWIDPVIWVQRLIDAENSPAAGDSMGLYLSILRLAPDNRESALTRAKVLGSENARLARFALGENINLNASDSARYSDWICAARTRNPTKDWTEHFAALEMEDEAPDGIKPAHYHWELQPKGKQIFNNHPIVVVKVNTDIQIMETTTGQQQQKLLTDNKSLSNTGQSYAIPTCALTQQIYSGHIHSYSTPPVWAIELISHTWPARPHAMFALGAKVLSKDIDRPSSNESSRTAYLKILLDKPFALSDLGHLIICLGLAGKDADAQGYAIDAVIEGIDSGQFDPELFSRALSELSKDNWIKLNRVAEALKPCVHTSPLHAWVVSLALQKWLIGTNIKTLNIHHILECLVIAHANTHQPLNDVLIDGFSKLTGSSKTTKLAKKLLELNTHRTSDTDMLKRLAISSRLRAAGVS